MSIFVRMWRLYLAGSIAAFETGTLQLFQVLFTTAGKQSHPADARIHVSALSGPDFECAAPRSLSSAEVLPVPPLPRRLQAAGADVLVLDKASFPRHKLCAGWITPQVVGDLQLEISSYPHRFLSFRRLHWHLKGLHLPIPCVQHSIRRFEFDAWLLERCGAPVLQHAVKNIRPRRRAITCSMRRFAAVT